MPTIKTVKAAGGKHYTSLGAWYAYASAHTGDDPWAECYDGDCGSIAIGTATWTPDNRTTLTKIYTPLSERTDGTVADTGCAYLNLSTSPIVIDGIPNVTIEGFRVQGITAGAGMAQIVSNGATGIIIDSMVLAGAVGGNTVLTIANAATAKLRNIAHYGGSVGASFTIAVDGTAQMDIQNCTLINSGYGGILSWNSSVHAHCSNVVFLGVTSYPSFRNYGASANYTVNYCSSEDTSADDNGGTGNVISIVPADYFVGPTTDLHLKAGSGGEGTGQDLSATFTNDLTHASGWRTGMSWDRGPFQMTGAPTGPPTGTMAMMGVGR